MKRFLIPFFLCFFVFNANAENTPLQQKKLQYVKYLANYIFDTMTLKDAKEKKINKIRKMIESEMDFEWNAKMALGAQGRAISSEDFKKFASLYKELLCQNWATKFSVAEMTTKEDIIFSEKVIKLNPTDDLIGFYIETRNGNKIDIKIIVKTMNEDKNQFKVIDLIGEGVSIALSYRSQFSSYIDANGIESIIPYLETIVNKKK